MAVAPAADERAPAGANVGRVRIQLDVFRSQSPSFRRAGTHLRFIVLLGGEAWPRWEEVMALGWIDIQ